MKVRRRQRYLDLQSSRLLDHERVWNFFHDHDACGLEMAAENESESELENGQETNRCKSGDEKLTDDEEEIPRR